MATAQPPLPTQSPHLPPQAEEDIDPRRFRERHFGLWGAQLLLAGGLVWIMVSGLRTVQQRDAQRKAAEKAGDLACGPQLSHKTSKKKLLALALSQKEAHTNTQEGSSPEEQRGIPRWLRKQTRPWGKIGWRILPSSLWTLSHPPLSKQQQSAISHNLLSRCGVDIVLSIVLTAWPNPTSPTHPTFPTHPTSPTPLSPSVPSLRPLSQPRLPADFSMEMPPPPGFSFRTILSFANTTISTQTADTPPLLLAHLPKEIIQLQRDPNQAIWPKDAPFLQILEAITWLDLLHKAHKIPPSLYNATLARICRQLQRGGAKLSTACIERLQTPRLLSPPHRPQIPIPAGEVWLTQDGKERLQHVAGFSMDRDEADRALYAHCAVAGHCPILDDLFASSWDLPRDRLRVKDAQAACRWRKMTLPTEAQWMLAARGAIHLPNGPNPSPKRPYPWGDQKHTCQRANLHWCFPTQRNGVQIPSLLPIHRPLGDISPLGVRMLAGNVAEMMRDGMIKGGSAFSEALPLDQRGRIELRQGLSWVGFRCIKEN